MRISFLRNPLRPLLTGNQVLLKAPDSLHGMVPPRYATAAISPKMQAARHRLPFRNGNACLQLVPVSIFFCLVSRIEIFNCALGPQLSTPAFPAM